MRKCTRKLLKNTNMVNAILGQVAQSRAWVRESGVQNKLRWCAQEKEREVRSVSSFSHLHFRDKNQKLFTNSIIVFEHNIQGTLLGAEYMTKTKNKKKNNAFALMELTFCGFHCFQVPLSPYWEFTDQSTLFQGNHPRVRYMQPGPATSERLRALGWSLPPSWLAREPERRIGIISTL